MKIHFFLRTLNNATGGGSHYNSIAYIRALRRHGHSVIVHVFYSKGSNSYPKDILPIEHEGFGIGHLREQKYLAKLLKEYESDAGVFFLWQVEFCWGGGLYRRLGGKTPVVVYMESYLASMRTTRERRPSQIWYQYKRLLWDKTLGLRDARFVDRYLPTSPYIGEMYIRFGFPKDRFTVLPSINPNVAVPHLPRETGPLTVLYVGRLTWVKGVDLAVEAMNRVKEFGAKFLIVGDGEMRPEIEKSIAKTGITVQMTGWIPESEVDRYYEEADIFLHPARWPDPAPRTVVTALQHGLPVIVPDTGGCAWLAGEAGIVYKTADVDVLTDALRQLLASPELRTRLSCEASKQVSRFEESAVYPQIESVLLSVIQAAKVS